MKSIKVKKVKYKWLNLLQVTFLISSLLVGSKSFSQISQTVHFSNVAGKTEITPKFLFDVYLDAKSHEEITGFPVKIQDIDQKSIQTAAVGDVINAFCFSDDMCGLKAKVLALQTGETANDMHVIVLSWWTFAWMEAIDKEDLSGPLGSHESIVTLTFKKTKNGAQIELNQINVPDYKVKIESPDGTIEIGPLSQIVNTHWHTLYWDKYRKYLGEAAK